jgi:hypothetical protein
MNKRVHGGVRIAVVSTIALLTVVSPLCAPLCAATACASGISGADSCHHASASTADGAGAIGARQLCNLKELPAAALRDGMSVMKRHAKRTLPLLARDTASDEPLTSQSGPSLLLRGSATSNDKPPAITALRI